MNWWYDRVMLRSALVLVLLVIFGSCSFSGTKGGKPGWKIYKDEQDRPVPQLPLRAGSVELRLTRVVLQREHTVLKTVNWSAWLRATVTSAEKLPAASLSKAFKLHGRSGRVYEANSNPYNANRAWIISGEPIYLPPNVPGELNIWASFESSSDKAPDEPAALEFNGMRLQL